MFGVEDPDSAQALGPTASRITTVEADGLVATQCCDSVCRSRFRHIKLQVGAFTDHAERTFADEALESAQIQITAIQDAVAPRFAGDLIEPGHLVLLSAGDGDERGQRPAQPFAAILITFYFRCTWSDGGFEWSDPIAPDNWAWHPLITPDLDQAMVAATHLPPSTSDSSDPIRWHHPVRRVSPHHSITEIALYLL